MKKNRRKGLIEDDIYSQMALKKPVITPKMDKEKILKVICKHHLMFAFVFGRMVGKSLSKSKYKNVKEFMERLFKNTGGFSLTLDLKKAGVLPLPPYRRGKAA